tara:strand:- start:1190 stop:1390 length:201 start_codon:yes stop_codon:yes gene_type:complete
MTRPLSLNERRSLAAFKGHRTRRDGKAEIPKCPGCGEKITGSVVDHMRRKHVDLYQRRARKHGDML